jgi:hypothetical protein
VRSKRVATIRFPPQTTGIERDGRSDGSMAK